MDKNWKSIAIDLWGPWAINFKLFYVVLIKIFGMTFVLRIKFES